MKRGPGISGGSLALLTIPLLAFHLSYLLHYDIAYPYPSHPIPPTSSNFPSYPLTWPHILSFYLMSPRSAVHRFHGGWPSPYTAIRWIVRLPSRWELQQIWLDMIWFDLIWWCAQQVLTTTIRGLHTFCTYILFSPSSFPTLTLSHNPFLFVAQQIQRDRGASLDY